MSNTRAGWSFVRWPLPRPYSAQALSAHCVAFSRRRERDGAGAKLLLDRSFDRLPLMRRFADSGSFIEKRAPLSLTSRVRPLADNGQVYRRRSLLRRLRRRIFPLPPRGNSSPSKIHRHGRRAALRLPALRLRSLLSRRITTAIATGTTPNDGEKKWRIFVK